MKLQEITFRRPVKIVQVFRNINIYGKADKSFENRKATMEWKPVSSKSGYVVDNDLFLPEKFFDNNVPGNCEIITLEDNNQQETFSATDLQHKRIIASNNKPDSNRCFKQKNFAKIDIFEIKDDLELFLKYDQYEVGIPERENFKLCILKRNNPVEIKINGKTDFSMTSGRERTFKEQHYIFEYLGDFGSCKILKEPYESVIKRIPEERKIIDLIKPLW
jgi:hypothetical protein